MKTSLVYRSARLYDLAMRGLYGWHYPERYRSIARLIPDRASVLEICCGPGFLYEYCLKARGVEYAGLDVNPAFVRRVERLGGRGLVGDAARAEPWPESDYVVMHAALYQFLPDARPVLERMLAAARAAVIVSEPVRNLATSGVPILSSLARRATDPGLGARPARFTERSLDEFFAAIPARLAHSFLIPGGREKVYVLDKTASPTGTERFMVPLEVEGNSR